MRSSVLFLLISVLLSACGGKSFKLGDNVTTVKKCMATTSEAAYDEMTAASVRKDVGKIRDLVMEGELFVIEQGKSGVVKNIKFGKYLVQFAIDGEMINLWVASEFVE